MMRVVMKCLGFKSHRRRTAFLLVLCLVPVVFMLYTAGGARPEVGYRKDTSVVQTSDQNFRDIQQDVETSLKESSRSEIVGYAESANRHRVLLEGCRKQRDSDWLNSWPRLKDVPKLPNSPVISTKNRVMFCLAGKVASSFFTRWILTMKNPGPMTSPYLIPIEKAGRGRAESLGGIKSGSDQKNFLESSVKIAFGRNPYSSIFSAYIDKLYSPNPFYWKYWGELALRVGHAPVKQCGSHVTFPEFVKAVTSQLVHKDVHLKQVADECVMCKMYYDVIGKLETTVPDLDYASQLINISSEFQHAQGYKRASQEDVVLDSLKSAFSWKRDIQRCISLDEMGLRIWRKLQIRGVIDSAIQYPFQPGQIDAMSADTFIQACQRAISASVDTSKLKRQKRHALEEAYMGLSPDGVDAIIKAYSLDFAVFGYPERPKYLFDNDYRTQLNRTKFLSWETPWNLP